MLLRQKKFCRYKLLLTFGFVPRRTVFRSLSSTSFCLIFLTTSTSCESATYRLFVGDTVCSAEPSAAEGVDADGFCSGEPGGVVESTSNRSISQNFPRPH